MRRVLLIIVIIMSVGVMAFIWGSSFLNQEASMAQSKVVADAVRAVAHKNDNFAGISTAMVRKAAHFAEFALLGALLASLKLITRRFGYALPFFAALFVAAVDETIQHFSGRSSAVTDVVLDAFGALCGILAVIVFELAKNALSHRS